MSKIVSLERIRAARKADEQGDIVASVSVFSGERESMDELTFHALPGMRPGEVLVSIGHFTDERYHTECALSVSASSLLNAYQILKEKLEKEGLI